MNIDGDEFLVQFKFRIVERRSRKDGLGVAGKAVAFLGHSDPVVVHFAIRIGVVVSRNCIGTHREIVPADDDDIPAIHLDIFRVHRVFQFFRETFFLVVKGDFQIAIPAFKVHDFTDNGPFLGRQSIGKKGCKQQSDQADGEEIPHRRQRVFEMGLDSDETLELK